MAAQPLDEAQVRDDLPAGWTLEGDRIQRRFSFPDFGAAMAYMVRVAFVCEAMNHHPNWSNVYSTLDVQLTTHDAGGVTRLDLDLANRMNALFG